MRPAPQHHERDNPETQWEKPGWKTIPARAPGNWLRNSIGCGLGDDAEQLSRWGFATTAFDISPTAIQECRARFPKSAVSYVVASRLAMPDEQWDAFHLVFESCTLQALPSEVRAVARSF